MITLSDEQTQALDRGDSIPVTVEGRNCVLVRSEVFEKVQSAPYDDSPWTTAEMDLLAAEAADLLELDASHPIGES